MAIPTIISVILAVLLGAFAIAALIFLVGKIFGFTFLVLGNVFRFIGAQVTDVLRFVSSMLACLLFAPLVVLSIVIGRWSASKHYAGSLMNELRGAARSVYRLCVRNPARLLGLGGALEGVEHRVPEAIAAAPTRDKPSKKRVGMFEGYKIVGSLKGGGSGGKLYIAQPDEVKRAVFAKRKLGEVDQVVIKVFSLNDGSSLPQIVRESRALDAARQLGLVLEHEMAPDRFYYVMRYVPGEPLSIVTQRMHTLSQGEGLGDEELSLAMGYMRDLLVALDTYHNAKLWHKDVKPDNIIVDGRDRSATAHLVDFGLVTPMRSAMTLTTHGTEYFRDPELVRQALRGVKVHQIDGSKFDVYAAGAVLYSMIENSFPAHGGLSQITKRCPETLRWITRRAMAEYDRRYPSAAAMLADLQVVIQASDPFALKPIDLPSVSQGDQAAEDMVEHIPAPEWDNSVQPSFARAGSAVPPRVSTVQPGVGRVGRPQTHTDFWSGRYKVVGAAAVTSARVPPPANRPLHLPDDRASAKEQVRSARARVQQRRESAAKRIRSARSHRRGRSGDYSNTPGVAVAFAGMLGLAVLVAGALLGRMLLMPGNGWVFDSPSPAPKPAVVIDAPGQPMPGMPLEVASRERQVGEHADAALVSGSLPRVQARLLVVSMLPEPLGASLREELVEGEQVLTKQGADLVGSSMAGQGDEQPMNLNASLRNAMGAVPIDTPEYPMRVQEWLGAQPLDGVLVLYERPGMPDHRRAMMITDKLYTDIVLDARSVPLLLDVLASNGYIPAG